MQTKLRVLEEEDAVSHIVKAVGSRRFIRINGHSGHGKTRLAKALSEELRWKRISIDDYVLKPAPANRTFVEKVDQRRLVADLANHLLDGLVVEGIWLDVLVPVDNFGPELKVYMLSLFSSEFHSDERRRKRQLETDKYHIELRPELFAEIMVLKAVA